MTERGSGTDAGDSPSPARSLLVALDAPRQARRGVAVGVLVAAVVYGFFVAVPGTERPPALYLVLGFVVAFSTAALVTAALLVLRASRIATGS